MLPLLITCLFARLVGSGNLANHVLAPERIRHSNSAFRIIVPLAIHQESVVVRAGLQPNAAAPDATSIFAQINWTLLPVGEVANQLDAQRPWCAKRECLLVYWFILLCHNFPFLLVVCVHR